MTPTLTEKEAKTAVDLLKDQFVILSFLVLYVGIVATEAFYSTFGIGYQFLGLPPFHVVYRGITTVLAAWYVAVPYLLVLTWFCVDESVRAALPPAWRIAGSYVLAVVVLVVTYPIAQGVGLKQAREAMVDETSRLPRIVCAHFATDPSGVCQFKGYLYLLTTGDEILLFQPVSADQPFAFPNIIHLKRGDIDELRTNRLR